MAKVDLTASPLWYFDNENKDEEHCILFIHGNSIDCGIFNPLLEMNYFQNFRLLAPDLPGHGKTGSLDVENYTINSLVNILEEFTIGLNVQSLIIIGHSLGGHIGIRLAHRQKSVLKGLIISGTPPLGSREDMQKGFNPHPQIGLAYKSDLSQAEARSLAEAYSPEITSILAQMIMNTDGEFRSTLLNDLMTCEWVNEVEFIQNLGIIPAIINGAEDPFINTEYIEGLNLRLFEDGIIQIEAAGHCGIYTHAESFKTKIAEYVNTLTLF